MAVPYDIKRQIFCRLPIRSICRFRSVCVFWGNLAAHINNSAVLTLIQKKKVRQILGMIFLVVRLIFSSNKREIEILSVNNRHSEWIHKESEVPLELEHKSSCDVVFNREPYWISHAVWLATGPEPGTTGRNQ
ncbi:hypothetical protein H5410_007381 [Solanum commersonii]|uniref:F-box domain-containing protein n=1 Tax=Solanum commersonii TaxID=4109 RepID=A0A9J6ACX6_SOLCO|nr:hypothetical protein H5410_007381 [Solanum commersonii]